MAKTKLRGEDLEAEVAVELPDRQLMNHLGLGLLGGVLGGVGGLLDGILGLGGPRFFPFVPFANSTASDITQAHAVTAGPWGATVEQFYHEANAATEVPVYGFR